MSKKMTELTLFAQRRSLNVPRARRTDAGFTLIEILVAMVVLAIGLLGVAAMQARGMTYNHDAYIRSQISVLAYDMADRMRLNSAAAADYATPGLWTVPVVASTACAIAAVSAANDLACWQRQIFTAMPPGSTADIVADVGGEYTIRMRWLDRLADPADPDPFRTVDYTFQP